MRVIRTLFATAALLSATVTVAQPPVPESPLPELKISDRGELVYQEDDFSYKPWSSSESPGTIHVLQYFGATMAASDRFRPFTDLLQESLEPGTVHVTTIINLDAALWGTSGFVISELKKNKKMHPTATMVVDEEGAGVNKWSLGKKGSGLVIVDASGKVMFFSNDALSEEQMQLNLEMIKAAKAS